MSSAKGTVAAVPVFSANVDKGCKLLTPALGGTSNGIITKPSL